MRAVGVGVGVGGGSIRAVARSGGVIDEAGELPLNGEELPCMRPRPVVFTTITKLCPAGTVNREIRWADRCGPEAGDTTVAKVIRADVGRIVPLGRRRRFDVSWPPSCRVDCDGVQLAAPLVLGKGEGL